MDMLELAGLIKYAVYTVTAKVQGSSGIPVIAMGSCTTRRAELKKCAAVINTAVSTVVKTVSFVSKYITDSISGKTSKSTGQLGNTGYSNGRSH